MKNNAFVIAVALVISWSSCIAASIPRTLNYQGTLQTSTGQPVGESQDITFSLYTTPLGSEVAFWTETLGKVPVSNGQFSVTLGATTPIDPAKFIGDTYIGIKVGTQPEMTPRQKLTSVAYSYKAVEAQTALSAQTAAFATTAIGVVPSGGIIMWSGTTVPSGWALCDGSNGTPDLRSRFVIGSDTSYPLGVKGGESSHTLTVAEMPTHNHPQTSHKHRLLLHNGSAGVIEFEDPDYGSSQRNWPTKNDSSQWARNAGYTEAQQPEIQNSGGGSPHNNLPPYYSLAFIMKL